MKPNSNRNGRESFGSPAEIRAEGEQPRLDAPLGGSREDEAENNAGGSQATGGSHEGLVEDRADRPPTAGKASGNPRPGVAGRSADSASATGSPSGDSGESAALREPPGETPESEPRLLERLARYCASDALPMHMPGHKRNPAALNLPAPASIDITEIDGFDNLHGAEDLLLACQRRAARVFGAEETHFLVNGSSGGILAAITACVPRGGTLLMGRNAHKSALNAVTLGGIRPRYLYPDFLPESGISGAIPPGQVESALEADPDIRCAFITSPTYEGVISDVAAIAEVCHRHGAALIVDEAHGAHLGFGGFPQSAIRLGADVAIQSVHKTLGSLTQTALFHISGPRVNRERLRQMLTVYQTSSPSYILMASIDECVCQMGERGNALAGAWLDALAEFRRAARGLSRLRLLPVEAPWPDSADRAAQSALPKQDPRSGRAPFRFDPSKIVISTHDTNLSGPGLQRLLRERFHIELEMAAGHYAIAMTGVGDTRETLSRLAGALLAIDGELRGAPADPPVDPLSPRPRMRMTPAEADGLPAEDVPVREADGRVCAEAVFAYPPGISLMVPGEIVDGALLARLLEERNRGVALHSATGGLPRALRCLKP